MTSKIRTGFGLSAMGFVLAACASPNAAMMAANENGTGQRLQGTKFVAPLAMVLVSFDENNDTILSREEFETVLPMEWSRGDINEDLVMNGSEFERWATIALGDPQAMPNRISFDTDLNGSVSTEEFVAKFQSQFEILDVNGDDMIARNELIARLPAMQRPQSRPQRMPPGMMPPGGIPQGGQMPR